MKNELQFLMIHLKLDLIAGTHGDFAVPARTEQQHAGYFKGPQMGPQSNLHERLVT